MDKRQKVIERIKKVARQHYYASIVPDHLDCGRHMASNLGRVDYVGELAEYKRCKRRLQRIDPEFPPCN